MQKFVRAVMGTNTSITARRLCHSPSVEAMLVSMARGATSNSYVDYEEAGCVMVVAPTLRESSVIAIRFRRAMHTVRASSSSTPSRIELVNQADLWIAQRRART